MVDKLNEAFNYRFHGNLDVSEIAKHLDTYSHEWFINNSRQKISPVHKETTSVFVYDHNAMWSIRDPYQLISNDSQKKMQELLHPLIHRLENIHDGKVGKCLFIKLPAGKSVAPHTDKLDYLGAVRRHHIAIKTNKDVFFFVNKEAKNMEVGDCWEINNSLEHYVTNSGETERIHLLVDIMPNRFINR